MSNKISNKTTLEAILGLTSKMTMNQSVARKLNLLMDGIKSVGLIEQLTIAGNEGNYLIIDSDSWDRTSCALELDVQPRYVLWEENEFFHFIESYIKKTDIESLSLPGPKKAREKMASKPLKKRA